MFRNPATLRLIFFFCGIPFLYYVLTRKEPDIVYYISLGLVFAGAIVGMVLDWRAGNKRRVYTNLIMYGLIIAVAIILALVQGK